MSPRCCVWLVNPAVDGPLIVGLTNPFSCVRQYLHQGTFSHSCHSSLSHYGLILARGVKFVWPNLHFKNKKEKMQAGNELSNILPKSLHKRKRPPPHSISQKSCLSLSHILQYMSDVSFYVLTSRLSKYVTFYFPSQKMFWLALKAQFNSEFFRCQC